LTIQHRRKTLY